MTSQIHGVYDGSQQFTIEKMFYIFHETFSSLYFERLLYYCMVHVHGLLDRFVIYIDVARCEL